MPDPTPTPRRWAGRVPRVVLAACVAFAALGAIWSVVAPLGEAPDEPAHLALAFARQQPFVASVLMAASSVDQLRANLGAIGLSLSKEVVQAVNAIHDANPNPK